MRTIRVTKAQMKLNNYHNTTIILLSSLICVVIASSLLVLFELRQIQSYIAGMHHRTYGIKNRAMQQQQPQPPVFPNTTWKDITPNE